MKGDRYEVLYKVVRIANNPALNLSRSCKEILRLLSRCFELESLSFFLLDPRRKAFLRLMRHPGPDHFDADSRKIAGSPEGDALRGRRPVRLEDQWLFPVFDRRQDLGVLILQAPSGKPLPEEQADIFRVVCEELARLIGFDRLQAGERQRIAQLALLSDLGRELNRASSLRDLMDTSVQTIMRHTGAACVILRPLYGGVLLGRSYLRLDPAYGELRSIFLDLEEEHYGRALVSRKPVFRQMPLRFRRAAPIPPEMVFIPLVLQDQVLGVLALFSDSAQSDLSFTAGSETRKLFAAIGSQVAYALERVWSHERLESLSLENDRKLQETSLLYRISKAIHSTLRLDELMHLILSAAAAPGGGGFERSMLFTVNERTNTLQGMLCVTRETASLVLPAESGAWDRPLISPDEQQAQRESPWCRMVMKQRLPLDPEDNPLARAVRRGRVIFVTHPENETGSGKDFIDALQLAPFACAPLLGRDRPLGVLVVDNPQTREPLPPDRRRFLELFATQAGSAMENSLLLHRLEAAHQDLRETQERLIQGEKMATLGEMAASIAHELRNPLVPIGGFADRLGRMVPEGSREKEYTTIITREVRRMEELLSNILAFSKKQMLCFIECRLPELIEEAIDLEREALARGAVRVEREIDQSLPIIQCDDKKLRQVLINLIDNACQAMPGGGTLVLRAYRSTLRGAEAAAIEVEDSGGGISPEVLRNMFNPFFTTKEGGTGLGLSISHRIIEHHRGEIEVKNRERGVVFIIRLPLHPD